VAKIKETIRKKIKDKEILVDKKAGTATVTVTLHPKRRDELATKLISDAAKILVEETGLEVDGLIKADTITNKRGEATGQWVFSIKGKQETPKKEPVKKNKPIEKKTPVKKETTKKQSVKKVEPKKAEPKKEESSSGFFAKRDKKKGNK
jgi:hypothetical protein